MSRLLGPRPRLPLTASPSVWVILPHSRSRLHHVSVLYLDYPSPALRRQISICQTPHHQLHHHHHPPALAWKVPGNPSPAPAAAESHCSQPTVVFQVRASLGLCRIRKPAALGWKHACMHSSTLGASAPRGRKAICVAFSQTVRTGANRNLRDSRSPSFAVWEKHTRQHVPPAVDCRIQAAFRASSNFVVGRGTVVSGRPATAHQCTASTQPNARTHTRMFHVIAVARGSPGGVR